MENHVCRPLAGVANDHVDSRYGVRQQAAPFFGRSQDAEFAFRYLCNPGGIAWGAAIGGDNDGDRAGCSGADSVQRR